MAFAGQLDRNATQQDPKPAPKTPTGRARRRRRLAGLALAFHLAVLTGVFDLAGSGEFPAAQAAAPEAALVVDTANGAELFASNAGALRHPASLTKLMTLYITFGELAAGRLSPGQALPVSKQAAAQAPSRLGLKAGSTITVHDAIQATVVKSANDAAVVLADAIAGNEVLFAKRMTQEAHRLGMSATYFYNASGLPHRGQITSARDMTVLARALLRDFPRYYPYFATRKFSFGGRVYKTHNDMLEMYPGTDGLKTGYIRASGYNLITSVEREGRRLIGVVLGARTPDLRSRRMRSLLDHAFATLPAARPPVMAAATEQKAATNATTNATIGWGVEIGMFDRFAPAHLAVTRATRQAPTLLMRTRLAIAPTESDGKRQYRARLVGMTQSRAQEACAILTARETACTVVSPADNKTTLIAAGK